MKKVKKKTKKKTQNNPKLDEFIMKVNVSVLITFFGTLRIMKNVLKQ